ncbi:adenylyl-sulfate kinase [Branchiibius sp. NY16-3462-2]|uniref:adenylyl-sulfate kinase n=1 Tax=Branchiibius sp. NY16-3462-2 TaxID=1807500 RepID=UPI000A910FF1|nr:adenylyl-sulfate kinase [Branchiibius sp. NY16-3462-2]
MSAGITIWLTGLSGAGKSTIAEALAEYLTAAGVDSQILDGDELRTNLSAGLGFSREDRTTHVTRVGFVAELLSRHGVVSIVPVIAPYADARATVRAHHESHGTAYAEVYVATTLAECQRRDVKGLYAKAAAGQLRGMTGVDDPYEAPVDPDLTIQTEQISVADAVRVIVDRFGIGAPALVSTVQETA